jgi:hypothetical protein
MMEISELDYAPTKNTQLPGCSRSGNKYTVSRDIISFSIPDSTLIVDPMIGVSTGRAEQSLPAPVFCASFSSLHF